MREYLKVLVVSYLLLVSMVSDADECGNACQEMKVTEYFSLLSNIYQKHSDVEDIEALFEILSPDVTYEHLNYGATFNREEWKVAFLRNLERGSYTHEPNRFIKIENIIHGNNYVAVAYSDVYQTKQGSIQPKGDQHLLALFSLTNGKISSVKEYW